jgi:signal recognition particle subunit SRP54
MFFEALSSGFKAFSEKLKGYDRLSEENLKEAFEYMKKLLIDADVDYKFVKNFLEEVKTDLIGQVVNLKPSDKTQNQVTPGEYFLTLCKRKLTEKLYRPPVDFQTRLQETPSKILMVGLQGVGKTTQSAKLGFHIQKVFQKKVCLVACDDQRPAAAKQLRVLSEQGNLDFFDLKDNNALVTANQALESHYETDCFLFDTAGRLSVDEESMTRVEELKEAIRPQETILVLDSLMGQQAVQIAHAFHQRLGVDGVLLTKFDADSKGGAGISILANLKLPIYFLGIGETLDDLMVFHLESLIDGMFGSPDIKGVIESVEKIIDEKDEQELSQAFLSGNLNFHQFLKVIKQTSRLAEGKLFFAKLGLSRSDMTTANQAAVQFYKKYQAIFDSMTPKERNQPQLLLASPTSKSRIRRLSEGSGLSLRETQKILSNFSTLLKSTGLIKLMMEGVNPQSLTPSAMKKAKNPILKPKKKQKDKKSKYKNR